MPHILYRAQFTFAFADKAFELPPPGKFQIITKLCGQLNSFPGGVKELVAVGRIMDIGFNYKAVATGFYFVLIFFFTSLCPAATTRVLISLSSSGVNNEALSLMVCIGNTGF